MYSYGYLRSSNQALMHCMDMHISLSPADVRQLKLLYLTVGSAFSHERRRVTKALPFVALQAKPEA